MKWKEKKNKKSDILCIIGQMFREVGYLGGHDTLLGTHPKNLQKEELCLLLFLDPENYSTQARDLKKWNLTVEDSLEKKKTV